MKRITLFAFLFACTLGFSQHSEIKGAGTDNPVNYGQQRHTQDIQSRNSNSVSGKGEIIQLNAVDSPSVYRNGQAVNRGTADASLKNAALQGPNQPVTYRATSPATYIYPVNVQDQQAEISANAIYEAGNRAANQSPVYGANRPMADIVPTAGATETFTPNVGDNFFDPGGPGGGSSDGTPGNYPNCGCDTQTTLAGVSEIDFLYFSVFSTFDYLRIYDGTDATGTLLYDNGAGGANANDITLDDMIASHGSSTFTAASGNFFFFFHASTVVDYGGWDVEIVATDGGGTGDTFPQPYCEVTYGTVEPISLVEVAGIDNRSSEVINGSPAHEDFTAIIGEMEEGESYTIALEGNTNGGFTCSFTVFIDWNQDGVLDNASERYEIGTINNSTGIDGQQATGTITVPAGVVEGPTRMRVLKRFGATYSVDPCTGTSWGQAEDYTIDVIANGGGDDTCSEENPNDGTFENGFNISSTTAFKAANDLTVNADEDFTLTHITASIFANGGIANVDVTYYADAAGLPGAIIGSEDNVTIDSQAIIGNNFGFDVNEVQLSVTPFVFSGQAGSETTYWIELIATDAAATGNVFWVVTSSTSNGYAAAQFDGGWALDTDGFDGVYIFAGECGPMDDNSDDMCSEENPNDGTFENGFNISSTTDFKTANDLTVAAGEDFTLMNITASIFANGGIANVDVVYYEDAAGLPGAIIGSQNSVTIDSQAVIGNNFGFDVNEVEMTVTPFVFSGQEGSDTTYWIELIATDGGSTGSVFWVVTSSSMIGNPAAQFNAGWSQNADGFDGVYIFEGECEPMDDNGDVFCSEENPNDGTFENGFNISSTTDFKTANDLTVAAGEDFTLTNITASIFANGGIANVDVVYYDDAAGLPGAVIGSQNSVTIDSQAVIGNNFGFDVNEVEMTVTPFVFSGQEGSDTTYWIELIATDGGSTGSVFWVVTSSSMVGNPAAQYNGGWAQNGDGFDGVYIFEGECDDIDGGDDECSEENPNDGTFENGFNISSTTDFKTANDLTVAAGEDFTLTNITASIFANAGISNVDVVYYDDASGLPGTIIGSENSVTIDSQAVIGNNFGFDVNEVNMTVAPFVFSGQAGSDTTYWIELIATDGGSTGSVFWVVTSSSMVGNPAAQFNGGWAPNGDGFDGVYIFEGECGALGVADAIVDGFTYYPNPTSGMLNLSADKNIQDIAVFNMLGQKVISTKVGATSTEIDFSSLAVGTYVMKVTIDGQIGTYKVIRN